MKSSWVAETPAEEGWYWIKYRGKRNRMVKCPCQVWRFKDAGVCVVTAYNDSFFEGPNHGGPGLKYAGKLDKSIRFGPKITVPD